MVVAWQRRRPACSYSTVPYRTVTVTLTEHALEVHGGRVAAQTAGVLLQYRTVTVTLTERALEVHGGRVAAQTAGVLLQYRTVPSP
ncbi:unnamed protein product [Euphydryas editha]|uniref:Uncharacterized protein n=1 Tax=Euphydryas editha TaxID=104508 RepID=A0AAU9TQD5_EUPED|nr:unnamed protein product [Euphydryas editha]